MTEAEITAREAIFQSVIAAGDLQASYVAIYLTLVFAYISFAFLAGKELTRVQVSILTIVFVAAAIYIVLNIVGIGYGAILKRAQLAAYSEARMYSPPLSQEMWDGALLWSLGILAACIFMWDRRRE